MAVAAEQSSLAAIVAPARLRLPRDVRVQGALTMPVRTRPGA